MTCSELREHLGREVEVLGAVSARRRIRTDEGEPMLFLTIEDATGLVEAVVFPDAYRRVTVDLDDHEPLLVTGKVEDHYGALTLVAGRVHPARRKKAPEERCGVEVDDGGDVASYEAGGRCLPWGGGGGGG